MNLEGASTHAAGPAQTTWDARCKSYGFRYPCATMSVHDPSTSNPHSKAATLMIGSVPPGALNQGTIFSCATAERYPDRPVMGLVITARCDVSNDKAQVYNYVPVVHFDDWLLQDGARILADRVERASFGDLRNILQQLNMSTSILTTMCPSRILDVIFRARNAEKPVSQRCAQFEKACRRNEIARKLLKGESPVEAASALFSAERTECNKIIKELCQNAVADAYFLPRISTNDDQSGYVVLMREIHHIPKVLANAISNGMDYERYASIVKIDARIQGRMQMDIDSFALPTGVIKSPYVEHFLQRLTLLFSRIGVSDIEDETIKELQGRINSMEERT